MPIRVGLKVIELWNDSMEAQVSAYEQQSVEKGKIIFYGSSEFTRWTRKYGVTPLEEVIIGKSGKPCAVNRGFGSSCSEHQLYYYPRMVRALEPEVLVYSCTGNAGAFGYSMEECWELAQRVVEYARTDFPGIHIYLCSSHPFRHDTEEKVKDKLKFGKWMKEYAEKRENCYFIDMMNQEMFQRKDIFIEDGVHFNAQGYELFAEVFRRELATELERF